MKLAKKTLLSVLIVLLTVITSSAQKVIINPVYGSATDASIKIERIQLTDTTTSLFFKVTYQPGFWINIDSNSHLQTLDGTKKYRLTGTKGLEVGLNKRWTMPDSGVVHYALIFPKLDSGTNTFDFIENEKSTWKIFGIKLISKNNILPEELKGNWITKDASGKWLLGLYDNIAIYNNNIWHYGKVTNQDRKWILNLVNGINETTFYLQSDSGDNCFIGSSIAPKILCSHRLVNIDNHKTTPQKAVFPTPFFAKGYATIKGYVEGYNRRIEEEPVKVSNGIITEETVLKMNEDGTFETEIPICHPGIYNITMPKLYEYNYHVMNVYLEAGKETVCYFNIVKDFFGYPLPDYSTASTLFMGDNADINNEFYQFIKRPRLTRKTFLNTDSSDEYQLAEYKKQQQEIKKAADDWVLAHLSTNAISDKTAKIIAAQNNVDFCSKLIDFNYERESYYNKKYNIKEFSKKHFTSVTFGFPYLNPVKAALKDTLNVLSYWFTNLTSRLSTLPEARKPDYSTLAVLRKLKSDGIKLTNEEEAMYNFYSKNAPYQESIDSFKYYLTVSTRFWNNNPNHPKKRSEEMKIQTEHYLKNYFDLPDFVVDLMTLKTLSWKQKAVPKPLEKKDRKELRKKFSNPVFADYLVDLNKKALEPFAQNAGSLIKSTINLNVNYLFESMLYPYRGSPVLVTFWEEDCVPCQIWMKKMELMKEELKDSSIEFICIASTNSSEAIWNKYASSIRGDHYRLTNSEFAIMNKRFDIKTIPRYLLINKKGEVVNKDLGHKTNEELKTILLKLKNE